MASTESRVFLFLFFLFKEKKTFLSEPLRQGNKEKRSETLTLARFGSGFGLQPPEWDSMVAPPFGFFHGFSSVKFPVKFVEAFPPATAAPRCLSLKSSFFCRLLTPPVAVFSFVEISINTPLWTLVTTGVKQTKKLLPIFSLWVPIFVCESSLSTTYSI